MTASRFQPIRIIARRNRVRRDWTAWFEDDPGQPCDGASPEASMAKLIERHRDRLPERFALRPSKSDYWGGHVERVLFAVTTCPECQGTGRYVGLQVIESCQRCAGGGTIPDGEPESDATAPAS